jgi:hypothetical protein
MVDTPAAASEPPPRYETDAVAVTRSSRVYVAQPPNCVNALEMDEVVW